MCWSVLTESFILVHAVYVQNKYVESTCFEHCMHVKLLYLGQNWVIIQCSHLHSYQYCLSSIWYWFPEIEVTEKLISQVFFPFYHFILISFSSLFIQHYFYILIVFIGTKSYPWQKECYCFCYYRKLWISLTPIKAHINWDMKCIIHSSGNLSVDCNIHIRWWDEAKPVS